MGFIEGKTVAIEYRFAEGRYERMPALAADLVARKVDVIVGYAAQGGLAAKAATSTIPVVFVTGVDPVQVGLVASFNRPGGNVTGTTFMGALSTTKQFGLVHELVPMAKAVGFLMNPDVANAAEETRDARASAQALGGVFLAGVLVGYVIRAFISARRRARARRRSHRHDFKKS